MFNLGTIRMAEEPVKQFLDFFTRQDDQNELILGKLDAILYWLRNDLPVLLGAFSTPVDKYLTEKSGGFNDGALGVGETVDQVLIDTVLQSGATNGYIHCQTGTITVQINSGEDIYLTAGLTINFGEGNFRYLRINRVYFEGKAAGSQFRMVLW